MTITGKILYIAAWMITRFNDSLFRRVEPSVEFFCDLDYDPFLYMQENNKKYGKWPPFPHVYENRSNMSLIHRLDHLIAGVRIHHPFAVANDQGLYERTSRHDSQEQLDAFRIR